MELLTTMRITFSIENSSLNMSENTTSKSTILILINCFKLKIFILTTNQDTQFVKVYDESKVAEIQGGLPFLQMFMSM